VRRAHSLLAESTVCPTAYEYKAMKPGSPPIGGPISHTSVYILDGRGQPVPIGATGELYVGGVGVSTVLDQPDVAGELSSCAP
jgi:non-ribosomal peptide synthetase component F